MSLLYCGINNTLYLYIKNFILQQVIIVCNNNLRSINTGKEDMMIQAEVQIEPESYYFIKKVYKDLKYKSLCEYVHDAINIKVDKDRKKLRELSRIQAMELIGKASYDNFFESIEGEDFETR